MNTQLKNQWIALEEQYHKLLKEKVKEYNLNNKTTIPTPMISSQLTFCKDGVIIKKRSNPENKSGISVMAIQKSINDLKRQNSFSMNKLTVFQSINEYNLNNLIERDLEIIILTNN